VQGRLSLLALLPKPKRPFRNWLSGVQLTKESLGLLQVERVETLGKPAVDRSENVAGLIPLALIAPEATSCRNVPP
jgi:hypothetical protein